MSRFQFGFSLRNVNWLTERDFVSFKEDGLQVVELSFIRREYNVLDWKEIGRISKCSGLPLWSLHLPYGPFEEINIANLKKEVRDYTVSYWSELIQKGSDLGIKTMVLHPSGEPNAEKDRPEMMKAAQDSLVKLAEVAERCGSRIAVEDLPRTCLGRDSDEIRQLLSVDERLGVCFDTNHLLTQSPKDFVADVGRFIITTHCSDYDFVDERHWLPGDGKLDWFELSQALEEVGYTGPLVYEVSLDPDPTCGRGKITMKDLCGNFNKYF